MIRPKSAVYLNLPCHFGSKQQSIKMKTKFKQQIGTLEDQNLLSNHDPKYQIELRKKPKYRDQGPSFLSAIKRSYIQSDYQEKQKKKKLKPYRKIPKTLIENMRASLNVISAQTIKLNGIIGEISYPHNHTALLRKQLFKRYTFKRKTHNNNKQNFFKTQSNA